MTINRQPRGLVATNPCQRGAPLPLIAALGGIPDLPGAACKGRPEDFDLTTADDPERIDAAKQACQRCPALAACAAWVADSPPSRRPSGVVAGLLLKPPVVRPLKEPRPPQPPRPPMADGATQWLSDLLADGALPAADIQRAARAEGFGKNAVHAAAHRLDVVRQKISRREVSWALPADAASLDTEGRSA